MWASSDSGSLQTQLTSRPRRCARPAGAAPGRGPSCSSARRRHQALAAAQACERPLAEAAAQFHQIARYAAERLGADGCATYRDEAMAARDAARAEPVAAATALSAAATGFGPWSVALMR